jgi:nicotinamide mononucleotide transporter
MIPVPVADWAGSIAAGISIVFLFRKSLWYWYFSIVATALWFYVFLQTDSLNVAGLQVFYTLFAVYGIARWHLQRRQRSVPGWLDHAGAVLALTILAATLSLTTFAGWLTWVELAAVALSIFANWLTALKIVWCWPIWISTNILFALLFFQLELWGVFSMQFVYAVLSLAGWRVWLAEERSFAEASIARV